MPESPCGVLPSGVLGVTSEKDISERWRITPSPNRVLTIICSIYGAYIHEMEVRQRKGAGKALIPSERVRKVVMKSKDGLKPFLPRNGSKSL